jgi:hypothetical protein
VTALQGINPRPLRCVLKAEANDFLARALSSKHLPHLCVSELSSPKPQSTLRLWVSFIW